jgi:hypothetical protein|tara:strand:+ start:1190 stop:1420 length:231 start_codon:yes stop_codon:yes gene_type:complete
VLTNARQYLGTYEIAPIPYHENNIQIYFNSLNFHDLDVLYWWLGGASEWTTTKTGMLIMCRFRQTIIALMYNFVLV